MRGKQSLYRLYPPCSCWACRSPEFSTLSGSCTTVLLVLAPWASYTQSRSHISSCSSTGGAGAYSTACNTASVWLKPSLAVLHRSWLTMQCHVHLRRCCTTCNCMCSFDRHGPQLPQFALERLMQSSMLLLFPLLQYHVALTFDI